MRGPGDELRSFHHHSIIFLDFCASSRGEYAVGKWVPYCLFDRMLSAVPASDFLPGWF